jgi:hypothetical protein
MEFPSWTPKWVVEEFDRHFSTAASSGEDWTVGDAQSREWIIQVINSPETRVVWQSLTKYSDREDRLAQLALSVWSARWGFGHDAIKRSDKAKIAKEARKHASALVECLNKLTVQDGFAMNSIVASFTELSISRRLPSEMRSFHEIWNEGDSPNFVPADTLRRAAPAIHRIAANILSDALFYQAAYHLQGGLCGSLDKWAEREPTVTKPEHENAERLYFIRSLTNDFMEGYGRPMRKETLALASVFFDCDGLDEAAISRLAPVRKRDDSEE